MYCLAVYYEGEWRLVRTPGAAIRVFSEAELGEFIAKNILPHSLPEHIQVLRFVKTTVSAVLKLEDAVESMDPGQGSDTEPSGELAYLSGEVPAGLPRRVEPDEVV